MYVRTYQFGTVHSHALIRRYWFLGGNTVVQWAAWHLVQLDRMQGRFCGLRQLASALLLHRLMNPCCDLLVGGEWKRLRICGRVSADFGSLFSFFIFLNCWWFHQWRKPGVA